MFCKELSVEEPHQLLGTKTFPPVMSKVPAPMYPKTKGFESNELFKVEWWDGSSWNEIDSSRSTVWTYKDITCGSGANENASFKVRFRSQGDKASSEYAYVDDVEVTGTESGGPSPPGQASNPSPADGATDVSTTADLSWTAGSGADSHDVYFGTTSPGTFQGNQTATTFDPGTMAENTTYYWRIDEKNAAGTTTGVVWSFTTEAAAGELPFSDGFESGNFTAGGWTTENANATITSVSTERYSGTYGAKLSGTTWIQKAVSTVGYNTIHVQYARFAKGLDASQNEKLFVEWSIDGSIWNNLETVPTTAWAVKDFTCGSGADNNANFRVRFRTNANKSTEFGAVDDVIITGTAQ